MTLDLLIPWKSTTNRSDQSLNKIRKNKDVSLFSPTKELVESNTSLLDVFGSVVRREVTSGTALISDSLNFLLWDASQKITQETEFLASTTGAIFYFDKSLAKQLSLSSKYLAGEIDIPGLMSELSMQSESEVVLILEKLGIHRDIFQNKMSEEEEYTILNRLAKIASSGQDDKYNSDDWITREVIASQRIESIVANREDFK